LSEFKTVRHDESSHAQSTGMGSQAGVIQPPETVIATSASGPGAGPAWTEPSEIENELP
jgi:hypothetical protein